MKEILTIAFFVIGNLIGAGFFCLPCMLAELGYGMIFSWIIALIIALTYTIIFGELTIHYKNASFLSDYVINLNLKKTIAYFYWCFAIISNVVLVNTNGLTLFGSKLALAFAFIIIITLINHFFEYETVANIETVLTALKFALLILLPLFLFYSKPDLFSFPKTCATSGTIFKVSLASFFSFMGIETAGIFGKGKSMKYGMFIGVICTFVLYVLSSIIVLSMVPKDVLIGENNAFISLISICGYSEFSKYISYLISFVCTCTLYGWIFGTAKISLNYAEDKLFPAIFLRKTKSNLSMFGLWLSSAILFFLYFICLYFDISNIFAFISEITVNMLFIMYVIAAYMLSTLTKSKFYYCLSWLGILLICLIMCSEPIEATLAIFAFILLYLYNKAFN